MEPYLRLVERCDLLVFSDLLGKATAGVGLEVSHALSKRIPVYELADSIIRSVIRRAEFLSREGRRRQLFEQWRKLTRQLDRARLIRAIMTGWTRSMLL